jgi:RecB family exonuclease
VLYAFDSRFPRRRDPSALLGSAIHQTLERTANRIDAIPVDEFEERWHDLLASRNFRELRLTVDDTRLERARRFVWSMGRGSRTGRARSDAEVRVRSRSGKVTGTIDRVKTSASGDPQVFEVKTGADNPDLLDMYRRQLISYAYLLAEAGGGVARRGALMFVLVGRAIRQSWTEVDIATQGAALEETATQVLAVQSASAQQGNVGEACVRCDYRPWCPAFWAVYRRSPGFFDSSRPLPGAELNVRERVDSRDQVLLIGVADRQPTELLLTKTDYPHADQIEVGSRIRVTDTALPALGPTRLRTTRLSELFVIRSSASTN